MRRASLGAVLALMLAGCATTPPAQPPGTTAPASSQQRFEAISAMARQGEHESDPKARAQLAADTASEAQACLAAEPQAAACLYGQALSLGLEARAHPAHAGESLQKMLAALTAAESADPAFDQAGPARVRALVLTRAPGWPLGPGDPAAAVVAARRAVDLKPGYPPNQLALAEALRKSGDAQGAHESYQRAHDAALAAPAGADKEEWLREADQALQH